MDFQRGGVPKDWKFTVNIPLFQGKGKRTECRNYRCISL